VGDVFSKVMVFFVWAEGKAVLKLGDAIFGFKEYAFVDYRILFFLFL
jgi:hypothetical protein